MAPADDEWPDPDWQYVHKHYSGGVVHGYPVTEAWLKMIEGVQL